MINLLQGINWKDTYIFATADVSSLYTVISHQHEREAVNHFFTAGSCSCPPKKVHLETLGFCDGAELLCSK